MRALILITVIAVVGSIAVASAQAPQTSQQTSQQTTKQTTTQTAPQKPDPAGTYTFFARGQNPVFEIGVRSYEANGAMSGSAGDGASDGEFQSFVWTTTSLCGLGTSNEEPSNVSGHGWQVKGAITSRSGDQVTVRFDWRRMWDSGKRIADGASGTKTLTMRNGERLELDRVVPGGTSSCGATEAKLEAAVVAPSAFRLLSQNWQVMDGTVTYAGRGAGGGRGAGAATGTTSGTLARPAGRGATTTTATPPAGQGARGAGASTGTAPTGRGAAQGLDRTVYRFGTVGAYDAELWLVHRNPDGTETVQQQLVRFGGSAFEAKFPPVTVQSSRGALTIDVTARLQAFVGEPPAAGASNFQVTYFRLDGLATRTQQEPTAAKEPTRVMLTIARRARASGNPLVDTTGSSAMAMDLPKPDDVLSFEFPALQKATEDLLKGHVFSLRVRITPAK